MGARNEMLRRILPPSDSVIAQLIWTHTRERVVRGITQLEHFSIRELNLRCTLLSIFCKSKISKLYLHQ